MHGAKILQGQGTSNVNSLEVQLPYKIKASTLREGKFGDFKNDLLIVAETSTAEILTEKEKMYLHNLFKKM
jgi:hypothetical protein